MSLVFFICMAAAMLMPPVRRSVPRWVEALIWLGLIASGWLTVTNVQGASTRFLTDSVTWGVAQIVKVSMEILTANLKGWLATNSSGIAEAVVVIAVLDIFLLAMLDARRQAKNSLPRVLLGEWFEFSPAKPTPASRSERLALDKRSPLAERTTAMAAAGLAIWFVSLISWGHNGVVIQLKPREARSEAGRQPVDFGMLRRAESVGSRGPIGQSSMPAPSFNSNEAEDGPTRLAS